MPKVEVPDVNVNKRSLQLTNDGLTSECLLVGGQAMFGSTFR
jgi:hypothetical protein